VLGCIDVNGLMKYVQPILKLKILQSIGRNSMVIYVSHWIVLMLSVRLLAIDILHANDVRVLLVIGGLSCVTIIPLYIKLLKCILQNKQLFIDFNGKD